MWISSKYIKEVKKIATWNTPDPSLVFFIICIALAIPAMILWGKYVLKPLYTFLSKKTKKPFYDGVSDIYLEFEPRGKLAIFHTILGFMPMIIVTYIIPELVFPGTYTIWLLFSLGMICMTIIIYYREDVFIKAKKTYGLDNMITIKHFQPEGYSLTYYALLSLINLWPLCFYGLSNYLDTFYTRFLVLTIICLIIEFLILFPDITDKFMPFDLKTSNGWWILLIFTTLISYGLSVRIYGMTSWV